MHVFADYIQPITDWLQTHPHWALFFSFVISFAESLAIVGSIVPGSITMTAIGILAGSGVMRIDLTLLAATLGAVAGDGLSYFIGYVFSDRMCTLWPFSRYPTWLEYGKDFFARHGGKSVLLGRFVGPLRSIIPVIAGMLHMSHWRFFVANLLSAIGWACLYVLPGVAIGAASAELSPESATRLFLFVLIVLAGIWLLSTAIKRLAVVINQRMRVVLHRLWSQMRHARGLSSLTRFLTPADESNHYQTALINFGFLLCLSAFAGLTWYVLHSDGSLVNQPVWLFLQSLRTTAFDAFFIIVGELISYLPLCLVFLVVLLLALFHKDWRSAAYWLSLNLSVTLVLLLTHWFISMPPPDGLLETQTENSFPAIQLTLATAQFFAILFFLDVGTHCPYKRVLKASLAGLLLIGGLSPLYLGDCWLTDVFGAYLLGLGLGLLHLLLYRRRLPVPVKSCLFLWLLPILLLAGGLTSLYFTFQQSTYAHRPYQAQYLFTQSVWWHQNNPILPVYRSDRIGRRIGLFNIQYSGNLAHFEKALTAYGWSKQKVTLFHSLLTRIGGQHNALDTPLMAPLYLNRKPALTMIYHTRDGEPLQIVRIWRSNYHIKNIKDPIWLGSVNTYFLATDKQTANQKNSHPPLYYISQALEGFEKRTVALKLPPLAKSVYHYEPVLLLVKEPALMQSSWRSIDAIF